MYSTIYIQCQITHDVSHLMPITYLVSRKNLAKESTSNLDFRFDFQIFINKTHKCFFKVELFVTKNTNRTVFSEWYLFLDTPLCSQELHHI